MPFIRRREEKYGKIGSLWLMDRGVPRAEELPRSPARLPPAGRPD